MTGARESRPEVESRTAKYLGGDMAILSQHSNGARIAPPRISAVRPVCTVHLGNLSNAHDVAAEMWSRTAALRPGTTVRLVIGHTSPPTFLPDVRDDLGYSIDADDSILVDRWIACLQRAAAVGVLA